jgi:hypothetical protein
LRLKWTDIDFEKGAITLNEPEKKRETQNVQNQLNPNRHAKCFTETKRAYLRRTKPKKLAEYSQNTEKE